MKTIRTLISFCLFFAATAMFAQLESQPLMKVNVPFQFTVANHTLPAGEYMISTIQPERTIRIASVKGKASEILTVSPLYASRPSANSRLVFNRYGDSYFLAEVWSTGQNVARNVPQGKREIEMASNGTKAQSTNVLGVSTGR